MNNKTALLYAAMHCCSTNQIVMSQFLKPHRFKDETWMTTNEAQEFFKVSRSTLYRWCKTQKVPYTIIGGTRYFPKYFIETLMHHQLKNTPNM
jgi:excisionase family DNA binding protein